ncbi:MAG: lysine--tRNA ligase, partial [Lachnospiraceae bacterium]|nr:lysine--tRNA ligase [Lachnospiraceae bacterium]
MEREAQAPVQDVNQLLKIRREKLAELKAAGNDPYRITRFDQKNHAEEILKDFDAFEGKTV